MSAVKKPKEEFWSRILHKIPSKIRLRASPYLRRVNKLSENEWLVWSASGTRYRVRVIREGVTCTCPYFEDRGDYCKHIAAVCANEIFDRERC